jgi:hypothetical protein
MATLCEPAGLRPVAIDGKACRVGPGGYVQRLPAQDPGKGSIKAKRLNVALDEKYLERILQGFKANEIHPHCGGSSRSLSTTPRPL